MALAPYSKIGTVVGHFVEKERGRTFDYKLNDSGMFPEFPHIVYVGPGGEHERFAKVLKTVCYMAVDEDAMGNPVVEKWFIKKHKVYR
jgi:hypothetical protein